MISATRAGLVVRPIAPVPPRSRQPWRTGFAPFRVRERSYRYEDEGSETRALGSVSVGAGAWWSVALAVPGGASDPGRDTVLLRVERHGTSSVERHGNATVDLLLPSSEIDAVVTLLVGVVAQARRDGVLRAADG